MRDSVKGVSMTENDEGNEAENGGGRLVRQQKNTNTNGLEVAE